MTQTLAHEIADRRSIQRGRDALRLAGELAAVDPLGAVVDAIAEPSAFTWDNPTGVLR